MAETTETIVFDIDITAYERALKQQADSIGLLTQKQKELRKAATEGNQEAAESLELVNAQLKVQQQEYRTTQAILTGYLGTQKKEIDLLNLQNNSIQQNRDLLKQLTAQVIGTQKPSQDLINKTKAVSDALKEQEGALGDTRRNVGNYASSIADAVKQISIGGTKLGDVIDPLKNIGKGFKDAGGGVAGLTSAFSAGLLGVVPLVAAGFSKIIDVFGAYKPIADAVEDATAGVSAGFKALVIGGDVVEAANQAIDYARAMRDLEDSQNIFNKSQIEGTNQVNRFILQSKNVVATNEERRASLDAASRAEKALLKEQLDRVDAEIKANEKIIVSRANLTEKQRVQLRDGTEAAKLEIRQLLEQRGVEDKYIEGFEKGIVKRSQLEGESINLREKIANRLAALTDKQQADADKAAEKERARLEKLAKDREAYLAGLGKLEDDFQLNEREKLAKSFDDKVASITGNSQREIILRLDIEQAKNDALEKFDAEVEAKRLAKIKQAEDAENARLEKLAGRNSFLEKLRIEALSIGLEQEQKLYELNFENRVEDLRAAGLTELEIEETKQKDLQGIREKYAKQARETAIKQTKDQVDATTAIVSEGLNVVSEIGSILDASINEKQKNLQEALDTGVINQKQYAEESAKLKKKQFEQNKAVAITSAILQGINATLAAYTSGAAIPIVGSVTGPLFAGLAAAFAAVQVGLIASQQPPKFAKGVIGLNGPGTGTSDSIDAKLSKGESVMTAKATAAFHTELAQMELAVGNSPNYQFKNGKFAGGIINIPGGDGGFSTRQIAATVSEQAIQNAILTGLQTMPAPVVSVKEIARVSKMVDRSTTVSEL